MIFPKDFFDEKNYSFEVWTVDNSSFTNVNLYIDTSQKDYDEIKSIVCNTDVETVINLKNVIRIDRKKKFNTKKIKNTVKKENKEKPLINQLSD
jgi:hypothetical protein